MTNCKNCQQPFEITSWEQDFHKRIQVPAPTHCPTCRLQRRVAQRNEAKLYKRECDFSKKNIISLYSPDKPVKVYNIEAWFGDGWDALEYGREFDFSRPFFEQFHELSLDVPKPSLTQVQNENSPYTTGTGYCKNCYLINSSEYCEDCFYGKLLQTCTNVVDSSYCYDSELLYECFNVRQCYNCIHLYNSQNCTDCLFSDNLNGCTNCCLCTNLSQKKYHFLNEPLEKAEYEKRLKDLGKAGFQKQLVQKLDELRKKRIVKYANIINSENSSGDFIRNCRNCSESYDVNDCEDCMHLHVGVKAKNLLDCSNMYIDPEFCYETMSVIGINNVRFSMHIFHSSDILYSDHCHSCHNLFGCSGLRNKDYYILNKQYTKDEYEKLLPEIITHLQKTGEWGEFFPIQNSPFCYNETLAYEYLPVTKEAALEKGWKWKDEDNREYVTQTFVIPENIADVPAEITSEILTCENCRKNYRIIDPELKFYHDMKVPVPHRCPDCRHSERMERRNPRKLWARECMKCGQAIQTTYPPESPETVYCERCYLETVY